MNLFIIDYEKYVLNVRNMLHAKFEKLEILIDILVIYCVSVKVDTIYPSDGR